VGDPLLGLKDLFYRELSVDISDPLSDPTADIAYPIRALIKWKGTDRLPSCKKR
jgi:hypothetical protein